MLVAATFGGKFVGDIHKKSCNQNQCRSYLSQGVNTPEIHIYPFLPILCSQPTEISTNNIPRKISQVNTIISQMLSGNDIFAPTNGARSQKAAMFMDNPDSALNHGFVRVNLINSNVTVSIQAVN